MRMRWLTLRFERPFYEKVTGRAQIVGDIHRPVGLFGLGNSTSRMRVCVLASIYNGLRA
jgi:hypothetical protein